MYFFHNTSQYLMKCCTSMPDMSRLIFFLHHCLSAHASQGRSSESEQPLPPGSIVGHANSGQFLGSLISDHCAQLLRVAVADGALRLRMRLPSYFIEYLTTALYTCTFRPTSGFFPRKPEVLCFAGTFRLIRLRQEEMIVDHLEE